MDLTTRPSLSEHAPYYSRYIDLVPNGDILKILSDQFGTTTALLSSLSADKADFRYAPEKWSIREVVGHMVDTERVFAFRALWFARNDPSPLPSFEQDDWMEHAGFAATPLPELIAAFRAVREATLLQLRQFPPRAWEQIGVASGNQLSVRAAAYIIAGHELHHVQVLHSKYLL